MNISQRFSIFLHRIVFLRGAKFKKKKKKSNFWKFQHNSANNKISVKAAKGTDYI
jgi:hypothetical protein